MQPCTINYIHMPVGRTAAIHYVHMHIRGRESCRPIRLPLMKLVAAFLAKTAEHLDEVLHCRLPFLPFDPIYHLVISLVYPT